MSSNHSSFVRHELCSERLQSIVTRSGLGFWSFRRDHDHYFCPNTFKILGLESAEASFDNFVSKLVQEDSENFQGSTLGTVMKDWTLMSSSVLNETIEFRITLRDLVKHIRCTGSVECDGDGVPLSVTGYLEDISSFKESEMQGLIQLSKMAALGQMTLAIVHEINNPVTALDWYALHLKRLTAGSLNSESFLNCVEGISKNAKRIAEIVSSIRFFTGGGPGQGFETSSLKAILQDTFNICQENVKWSSVEFAFDCDESINLECKPIQISQVFINLISNAVMAISLLDEKWIKINVSLAGEVVKIFVMDSGHGIPENVAKSMTKPYFTTKKRHEGTGIGLCISKAIVERHHGRLYYDATSERTLFVLELPIKQPLESAKETKSIL